MAKYSLTAFYGGTFDPIHYGHLQAITVLARIANLRRVVLLPNNIPPHRPQPEASSLQRLAMVRLAIAELSDTLFDLDDRELRRAAPSWTVETLEDLRLEYGREASLGFIMGQDSFLTLSRWHRFLALPNLCHLLVCARPGYTDKPDSKIENGWITSKLTLTPQALHQKPAGLIYCAPTPKFSISSSEIRKRYREGLICDDLLPCSVQNYIDKHGLYSSSGL